MTPERQAKSKESREWCGALGVGPGDKTSGGAPKDGIKGRSLVESESESDLKIL